MLWKQRNSLRESLRSHSTTARRILSTRLDARTGQGQRGLREVKRSASFQPARPKAVLGRGALHGAGQEAVRGGASGPRRARARTVLAPRAGAAGGGSPVPTAPDGAVRCSPPAVHSAASLPDHAPIDDALERGYGFPRVVDVVADSYWLALRR